ncbi:hypothetical protein Ahy_B07g086865 isoform C [Arachis hypogaea]|uniref:Uncharacterized protein n=1 Tax=Arachis hypogaea TaxID=3818 RepID=A0A444YAR1_ARAHY|nr:hypothetical protein Ahy_B07g086865 isoform C [Arachis hypogaea]
MTATFIIRHGSVYNNPLRCYSSGYKLASFSQRDANGLGDRSIKLWQEKCEVEELTVKIIEYWDTFDLDFNHQLQPNMRPLLPEICWNRVEDWEIEWEEIKARLLPSTEQEITATDHKSISPKYDIDEGDVKLKENLDLHLEHSNLEVTDPAEGEVAISGNGTSASRSDAQRTTNSGAAVGAVTKEEGDNTVKEGGG